MSGWLSPATVAGLTIAGVLAVVMWRDRFRGLLWFTVLASIPVLQVGAFSGARITEGLMMAEVLSIVLVLVCLASRGLVSLARLEVGVPLAVFLAVACVSVLAGQVWYDPAIDLAHLNVRVSLGQILLFALPLGVLWVAASVVTSASQAANVVRLMQALTLVQLIMGWVSVEASTYLSWTWSFGLMVAPFSFAEAIETRSWPRRVLLVVLALAPLAKAVVDGRAFVYLTLSVALGVVTLLTLRKRAVLPLAGALVIGLLWVAVSGTWLPWPLSALADVERQQRSLGGPTGRGALISDAVSIWAGHPLFGVGPGNSYPYMLRYSLIGTPHNQYANILLETGIVGLMAVLEFIRRALRAGLRVWRSAAPDTRWMAAGWLGLFCGLTVGSVAGDFMFHSIRNGGLVFFSQFYQQWILLGLILALDRGVARVPSAAPGRPTPWTRRPVAAHKPDVAREPQP